MPGLTKVNLNKQFVTSALILLFFLISSMLMADIAKDSLEVNIKDTSIKQYLKIYNLRQTDYMDLEEIAFIFKANIKIERIDKRIYLNIYDEQLIFLINSSYFTLKNQTYNLTSELLSYRDKYYIPIEFAISKLPQLFKPNIAYNNKKLIIVKPKDSTIKTIVIDPGHGGKDPGAVGRKIKAQEKDINLNVSLMLKSIIEKETNIKVILTRSDDRFVSLQERTKIANDNKADLFVSIHTNASKNTASHGVEMYYLSTAKTTEARAVEALENSVVEKYEGGKEALKKYDDVDIILYDILQAENLEHSNNLALKLQMNVCTGTKAQDRNVKQANFYVLRGAFMPAVLVEMGFISNKVEESFLVNRQYQERIARTLFEGIKSFKFRYDRIRTS